MRSFTVLLAAFFIPFLLLAQGDRSYTYDAIAVSYTINQDSTVSVTEDLTYDFRGTYHQGWRTLSLKGADRITNVTVTDRDTGALLTHVSQELDKNAPSSWGKFTTKRENGALNVIWYYDATDKKRTWTIQHTLHGAISFLRDKDELYWNAIADYDVPIRRATVEVRIPGMTRENAEGFTATQYPGSGIKAGPIITNAESVSFSAENIPPKGAYTVAVGWPKGLVDQQAYMREALLFYFPYLLAILIVLGSIVYAAWHWYAKEGRMKGRGTIVPQYEPPKGLRPAMAEFIMREGTSPKAWSATVVDLAVRGYVTITEDTKRFFFGWFSNSEYVVTKAKPHDGNLETYEKNFLDALFSAGEISEEFSTRTMKKSPTAGRLLYHKIQAIENGLLEETAADTGAYEISPASEKKSRTVIVVFFVLFFLVMLALAKIFPNSWMWVLGAAGLSGCLIFMVRRDARLNREGRILREEWFGFKMYLETAERLRLENLTPETFEKYLPYAMIFGIEKKWAAAFERLSLPPPSWYHGNAAVYAGTSGAGSGFSPTSFTSGFSASFSSAFAASGGSGASSGGGSAGGGGGGGGGGAS